MKKIIEKLSVYKSLSPLRRLVMVYAVFICLFVSAHIIYGGINCLNILTGKVKETQLTLADFEIIGGEITDDNTLENRTDDTQLIYTGDIRNLIVKCTFSENPGEFICFYNSKANDVFGTNKMEYTRIYDGYYHFYFPLGTKQIRLDTGVFPTTVTEFEEIIINRPTVSTVLGLTAGDLFTAFVIPGWLFMIIETVLPVFKKKK